MSDVKTQGTQEQWGGYDYGQRGLPGTDFPVTGGRWRPRTDLLEVGKNVRVEFELPGVSIDEIHLSVSENSLVLQTAKTRTRKEQEGVYYQRERHFGDFYRRLALPDYVDSGKVDAIMENGVLKIVMPIKEGRTGQTNLIPIRAHVKNESAQ